MSTPESPSAEVELLSFRLADEEYSVDIMSVREIRGWTRATPLPHAPAYVRGVINLRGTVMPVVDMRARLGFATAPKAARPVIVVAEIGDDLAGLMVDAVCETYRINRAQVTPPPSFTIGMGDGAVSGVINLEGKMVVLLDMRGLLPAPIAIAA